MKTRGIRNNNPLNIRRTKTVWQGMKPEVTDKEFVEFTSMAYGYRAAWRILFTYFYRFMSMKTPFTVSTIIDRWAPPTENPTKAYIDHVLRLTGLGGNERLYPPLNPRGVWKLSSILAAMTVVECGIRPEQVDTKAIREGYTLAFGEPYPSIPCHAEERSDEASREHTNVNAHRSFANAQDDKEGDVILDDKDKGSLDEKKVWDEYWDWSPLAYGE